MKGQRIADQKFAVKSLVTLYRNSVDVPGRSDTLRDGPAKRASVNPKRFFKKFRQGIRMAATTTTTALGNVASEIAGSSVLQPNSPQAMVKTALESANKSRLLARRLFYSFAKHGAEELVVADIARFFEDPGEAEHVFNLFDKDQNGDATRDEVEMACLPGIALWLQYREFHREQLSIENSMRDLDSAVGRLDNILISVYFIVACVIIAVALEAQLVALVTGAGTLILGLSWLIGGSLQEVLTSIIFLFIKHPFDVGDRVVINKESYTVKEIRLLSTVFIDSNSTLVQAPNNILNAQMSETFTFDVSYATTFEDLERLREKMLAFVKEERRDYQPAFDVVVKDFPEQEKMTLAADIKYKSNGQQGALKAKRRNKWICALKTALAELNIYGPKGNPNAPATTTRYTKVPYEEILAKERAESAPSFPVPVSPGMPPKGWQLTDNNAAIVDESNDIFGEKDELYFTSPRRNLSEGTVSGMRQRPSMPALSMPTPGVASSSGNRTDVIEMTPRH
ncbi:hypothetical protein H0H81_007524 [Sphagnurus paluster]|uniref:EF-hand domain-containing protein n=1 Tax=Sphagnurus paluster TaxID=117069 RepID=A0A9P7GKM6_9AGAR|nr:hypothetical protein H0H81_007524 [Sphagnurus paluster]